MTKKPYFIVYVSYSTKELDNEAMEQLLRVARAYNQTNNITGLLLHFNGRFLQVLEGEEEVVKKLYSRIQSDQRHHTATVVVEGPIESRIFKKWSMGYQMVSDQNGLMKDEIQLLHQLFEGPRAYHPILQILTRFYEKNINTTSQ